MGKRVPSQERAEVALIRMGYRKNESGGYEHPSGAGFTPLDMRELSPFEVVREARRMLDPAECRYGEGG